MERKSLKSFKRQKWVFKLFIGFLHFWGPGAMPRSYTSYPCSSHSSSSWEQDNQDLPGLRHRSAMSLLCFYIDSCGGLWCVCLSWLIWSCCACEMGEVLCSVDKVSPALSNMGTSQSLLVGPKARAHFLVVRSHFYCHKVVWVTHRIAEQLNLEGTFGDCSVQFHCYLSKVQFLGNV